MAIPTSNDFELYLTNREALMVPILHWNLGRLRFLYLWRHQEIDWNMILGAVSFWSPTDHVFRFGLDEVCPMIEEFSSLMGIDPLMPTALPFVEGGVRSMLSSFLGVSSSRARAMTVSGCLDLPTLVQYACHLPVSSHQRERDLVAALCLSAEHLLVTEPTRMNMRAVQIIYNVFIHDHSPIPTVLAETLNGLDALHADRRVFLRGSPLLLYMWLLERFRLVGPFLPHQLGPEHFFAREPISRPCSQVIVWIRWFASTGIVRLRWIIPGYRAQPSSVLHDRGFVSLAGLESSSFYLGLRLLRQMGISQIYPLAIELTPCSSNIRDSRIRQLATSWDNRIPDSSWTVDEDNLLLSPEYFTWLWQTVGYEVQNSAVGQLWLDSLSDNPTMEEMWQMYHRTDRRRQRLGL